MNGITLTQLRYLKAVVDGGGFSKAAERINVSQPALTRQVKLLEGVCGVPLLRRTARGVIVTEEGQSMLAAAQTLFDSLENIENVARSFTKRALRIRSVSTSRLAEFIKLCRRRMEQIDFDVTITTYDQILEALSQGECDVGFLTMPADISGFDVVEIGNYPFYAYLPMDHPWATRTAISINDLSGKTIIVSPRVRRSRQVFEDFLRKFNVQDAVLQEVGSTESIWHFVREGMGIGIMSYNGLGAIENLVRVPFAEAITIPLHFVSLPNGKRSRLVDVAVSVARQNLPES